MSIAVFGVFFIMSVKGLMGGVLFGNKLNEFKQGFRSEKCFIC